MSRLRQAVVLGLCVSAVAAPQALARPAGGPGPGPVAAAPVLSWRPCPQPGGPAGQECAELPVPLDYRDPEGPHLTLALSRLRSEAPAERRGTLLVIPGGPGASGVERLTRRGEALRAELGGTYDLVGLDPRGVGGSTTATCGLDPADRTLMALRPWPGAGGRIGENVARARRTAEACARNGGAVLRSFSTANQVRDIERLRRALGAERLSAYATSYGSYVAAGYAQRHPGRTDRLVLDGSGDPDPKRVGRGWLANIARGAEDRFPDFAGWAADPARADEGLRLAERAADVRPLFLDLAAELDRAPRRTTTDGVPLTGNRLRQAMHSALYADAAFPALARLVQQARDPGATPVLPPELTATLPDSDAAVAHAVLCNDVRWPASVPAHRRAVAADRAGHPLTAGMPVNITPCSFWRTAPADKPVRITDEGPSNVLMVQNLRDPATPYAGALRMRAALGDRARLVTVDSGGHGSYLANGNACGDRAVTAFLTTGRRPAADTFCPG
ncbi:alpha/beta hydrolase [Streptomyces sp. MAR4 CNX-425]|uniref:alpha/beta hydrolase n=1 Tax=Streptomyces sp. MAR4 CNX-425 TaxID=3406343 RepID=UPI003B50BCF8